MPTAANTSFSVTLASVPRITLTTASRPLFQTHRFRLPGHNTARRSYRRVRPGTPNGSFRPAGLNLELSPDLANWTQPTSTNSWAFDVYGWFPLAQTDLPGATQNFFRMVKPDNGQLQVLLPGESNAPNTPTGKTGTPAPQTLYNTFDLTINRCDATWHIVPSSDTVAITSTDTVAALPPDTALVNGTATISGTFYFNTSGTWTITATDVTTNTVSAGTSSPITIP